jgi:hypothetical protein
MMNLLGQLSDTDPVLWIMGFVVVSIGPVALVLWMLNRPKAQKRAVASKQQPHGFEAWAAREVDDESRRDEAVDR